MLQDRDSSDLAREALLFAASMTLVALVAIAIAGATDFLFLAIISSAGVAAAFLWHLFSGRSYFSLTFTNLVAVYASIFAFFMEELFGRIGPTISGVGFCLPIFAFLLGCWLRRAEIRTVIDDPHIRGGQALYGALVWLLPVFIVGAVVFVMSWFAESLVNTDRTFLLSMLVVGLIVLVVSRNVAVFLVDAGLLFDEFFQRMSRLAVPAFAFLTFYALLVILFASLFSIISQFAGSDHFRVGTVTRAISFSEAIHFSIVSARSATATSSRRATLPACWLQPKSSVASCCCCSACPSFWSTHGSTVGIEPARRRTCRSCIHLQLSLGTQRRSTATRAGRWRTELRRARPNLSRSSLWFDVSQCLRGEAVDVGQQCSHVLPRKLKHRHLVMARNDTGFPGIDEHFDGVARMELAERRNDRVRPLIITADGMTRCALSRGDSPAFLKHG